MFKLSADASCLLVRITKIIWGTVFGLFIAALGFYVHFQGGSHPEVAGPSFLAGSQVLWTGATHAEGFEVRAFIDSMEPSKLWVIPDLDQQEQGVESPFDLSQAREFEGTITEAEGVFRFVVTDLQPSVDYRYVIQVGESRLWSQQGRVQTWPMPGAASSFKVALGSCALTGSNTQVFHRIQQEEALFFMQLGDLHYENIGFNMVKAFHAAYRQALGAPAQNDLYRSTSTVYVWDDHDYGPNNSDRHNAARPAAAQAYKDFVPSHGLAFEDGSIARAFTVGRLRFIVSDARFHRDRADLPDGPDKTLLGIAQFNWLLQEFQKAKDSNQLIVWANSVPWIDHESESDAWGAYATERSYIAQFLNEKAIDNIVMVSGDAHMLALDDGTNSNFWGASRGPAFPVLQAGALDRVGSTKGGPYSHGVFPGGGQYGLLEVQDSGSGPIELILSGKNWEGEVLLQERFVFLDK